MKDEIILNGENIQPKKCWLEIWTLRILLSFSIFALGILIYLAVSFYININQILK